MTITSTHRAYPWKNGQAELARVCKIKGHDTDLQVCRGRRRLLQVAGRMLRLMRRGGWRRSWHDADVLWIRLEHVQRLSGGHLLLLRRLLRLMMLRRRRRVTGDDDGRAWRAGEQVGGHVLWRAGNGRADGCPRRRVDGSRQRR